MALTSAQCLKLCAVLKERFPNDSLDALLFRTITIVAQNNPSTALKTAISNLVQQTVDARNATLATYDSDTANQKIALTTDRDTIAAITPSL